MSRFGRLLGLIVAAAGVAAAHALVQPGSAMQLPPAPTVTVSVPIPPVPPPVPSVPVPTVPAPTVPAPTVPAPTVPAPTVPAPLPPPPRPAPPPPPPAPVRPPTAPAPPPVTTSAPSPGAVAPSTPPRDSRSAAGGAPQPAPSPAPQLQVSPTAGTSSGAGSPAATPSTTKRARLLKAKPHRTKTRVNVRLTFTLAKAERVFLFVRGPAPSCRVAGVVPVRGRKGANTVDFAGRVRGRALRPGVYLITISPTRRLDPDAPPEYVRVVSPRRSVPLADAARKPTCSEGQAAVIAPSGRILLGEPQGPAGTPALGAARPIVSLSDSVPSDDESGVLPDIFPSPDEIGTAARDSDLEALAKFAVLGFLGALVVGMLALVARFLRGSWNP